MTTPTQPQPLRLSTWKPRRKQLDSDAVRTIRRLASAGVKQRVIADDFDISIASVSMIVTRKSYRRVL